jgi:catechol 2,3-dioxygenase-like lactoylglutathione lyase family enzyme
VSGRQSLRLTRVAGGGAAGEAGAAVAARERARAQRFGGLDVVLDDGAPAAHADASSPAGRAPALDDSMATAGGFLAIDHVVIETPDPTRALGLWRDALGVRLALDREFPNRGLRMLFFRSAGVTLELVSLLGAAPASGDDRQNGIAYRVTDVARVRERLLAAGLNVSEVRNGNKPGTLVATVRDQTEGVPTLLIQAAPPAPSREATR